MTIASVNTWGVGDELTTAQINGIDTNTTSALDKRSSQTDTLQSVVSLSGAGRIIQTLAVGANADTSYLVSGGNLCIRVTSAVTANRNYTLSNTNAVTGDAITIYAEPSFVTYEVQIKNGGGTTLYTLGNLVSSDGPWASFVYTGAAWVLAPRGEGLRTRVATFTSSGTFVCPPNTPSLVLLMCGGGGGAGGGGGTVGTFASGSGGGGGGALVGEVVVTSVPGTSYTVTCGTGGAGGAGGVGAANGVTGSNGADTTFGALATARGASGGVGGFLGVTNTEYSLGGPPSRFSYSGHTARAVAYDLPKVPGTGGVGHRAAGGGSGTAPVATSLVGNATALALGGAAGADGISLGGLGVGAPGGAGGGASGLYGGTGGAGGTGGNGGDGIAGTNGGNGSVGVLGGGGGGGGGGGTGVGGTIGGDGGAGGNGVVVVLY